MLGRCQIPPVGTEAACAGSNASESSLKGTVLLVMQQLATVPSSTLLQGQWQYGLFILSCQENSQYFGIIVSDFRE